MPHPGRGSRFIGKRDQFTPPALKPPGLRGHVRKDCSSGRRSQNRPENLLESNGPEDETDTATDKFAKAFVVLGNNGLTNSNEQFKTYAVITRANYSEFGCVLRWFGRVLHNHVVVLVRCGAR